MILSYIYIHNEFRNLKDQEFNLDPEYIFFLNNGNLDFKPNPDFIDGFLPRGVNNVTAIIGQNGAGKSTFLKYIQFFLSDELIFENREYDIIIFRNKKELYLIYDYSHKKEDIYSRLKHNFGINTERFKSYPGLSKNAELKNSVSAIFYSNNFDSISEIAKPPSLINVSTNYFTQKGNELQRFKKTRGNNLNFKRYEANEAIRQLLFIKDRKKRYKKIDKELNYPNYVTMQMDRISQNGLLYNRKIKNLELQNKHQYDILKKEAKNIESNIYKQVITFHKSIALGLFNSFLISLFEIESFYDAKIKRTHAADKIEFSEYIFPLAMNFLENLSVYTDGISNFATFYKYFHKAIQEIKRGSNHNFDNYLGAKLDHYLTLARLLNNLLEDNIQILSDYLANISVDNKFLVELITVSYDPTYEINKFFDFKFRGMSSGQNSILKMFSRFHESFKIPKESLKPNVIILLDEADLHFHPEWQQKFLTIFLEFIQDYKNDRILENVQIICTSHSPFLASDLPKGKIIYMKNDNGNGIVSSEEEHVQTFGTNIHTLFLDSFFMNNSNGTLGDFAAKKIDEIIDKVYEAKEKGTKLDDKWHKKINMIGEEVIKLKLLDILKQNEKN